MANIKVNILEQPKHLLIIVSLVLAAVVFMHAPRAHAANCGTPPVSGGTYGHVQQEVTVPVDQTYYIWSRLQPGATSSEDSYNLIIDGGSPIVVGNNNTIPTGTWTWVNTRDGGSTRISMALTAGVHCVEMVGTEDGVKLDRIGMTSDSAVTPTGNGDTSFTADTTNPTVSVGSPTANNKVKGTINVTGTSSDNLGTVSSVQLYIDGVAQGSPSSTTSSYSLSWNTATQGAGNGTRVITVKATDPSGNVGTSASVSVMVDNTAPTVSGLTATPNSGGTVSGTVTLSATAADTGGSLLSSVSFYYGGNLIGSDTTAPYSISWNTSSVTNGSYALTAVATDGSNNQATSSPAINVTVSNSVTTPDTINPTTSITLPVSGATVLYGDNTVSASAGDNVDVSSVALYIDGNVTPAATDVVAPYTFTLNTVGMSNGTHTLVTKALDPSGNQGVSSTISITINSTYSNKGDCTGDGHDSILDLSTVLSNYGLTGFKSRTQGDLDNSGTVNIIDLSTVLSNYGT